MNAQEQRGGGGARAVVVGRSCAVRRADLDEPRAGARQYVGDAEAVADLDQLAARDEHLALFGERREREQHRGGVVVDDDRGLCTREAAQDRRDVILARPARPFGEVVLEIRVAATDLDRALDGRGGKRCAAEVRVNDDAGRVQHAAQGRRPRGVELGLQPRPQVAGLGAGLDLLAGAREHAARGDDGERVAAPSRQLVDGRKVAELHCASRYATLHGAERQFPATRRGRCLTVGVQRAAPVVLALVLLAASAAAVARGIEFRGAAKPGVRVLGIDVGGKSRGQIEAAVRTWARTPVTIRAGGRSYHVPRGWLVSVDGHATATRALDAGSAVALVMPEKVEVDPVVRRAGGAADVLREIARAGRPAVSASVTVHGTHVETSPAQVGRELDRDELLRRLAKNESVVDAPFTDVRPAILDPAARSAASTAELLLEQYDESR